MNSDLLPQGYYALAEQHAAGLDRMSSRSTPKATDVSRRPRMSDGRAAPADCCSRRCVQVMAETEMEFYRRKQDAVVVRHVSGDRMVAVVEVVSPGNKAGRAAARSFVEKAAELLERRIHLLILDLHPPGRRDPQGIHGLIWEEISGADHQLNCSPANGPW